LPIRAVWWLGRVLWTAIRAVGRGALSSPGCLTVLVARIALIVSLLLFRTLAAPAVIALVGAALGRLALDRAEYDADDTAVRLGLGSGPPGVLKVFGGR